MFPSLIRLENDFRLGRMYAVERNQDAMRLWDHVIEGLDEFYLPNGIFKRIIFYHRPLLEGVWSLD
jgi:hypothetical protein